MKKHILTSLFIINTLIIFSQNTYQYDNLNRLSKVTFSNGSVYDYSYDQLGNRTVKVITSIAPVLSDLVIQNQALSQITMAAGAVVTANCNVANLSTGNAGGQFAKLYLSSNQSFEQGTDAEIGSLYVSALSAGTFQQVSATITIPQNTLPGTWYVLFFADATMLANESDENNNIAFTQLSIVNCSALQLTVQKTNTTCSNNNGTALINITGGTPSYTYQWSNGNNSNTALNLSGGNYTATITDYYGCTSNTTFTINEIAPPAITMSSSNTTCGASNGSASVSITGGTSPYTQLWSTGQTTTSINNLSAGNYSVTITDVSSCVVSGVVTVNTPANLSISLFPTQPSCGNNNGSVSASVSGGMQPYQYLWSNSQTTQTANNLSTGNYSLTITDANNCQFVASTSLSSVNNMTLSTTATNTTCGNANGTATINTSNGTAPYSYLWSNGQTTQTANNLAPGTYNVTVTDAGNCSTYTYASVGSVLQPTAVVTSSPTSCTSSTGSASVSVSNGTAPYTYLWNTSSSLQTISGLPIGNYLVTVTDANQCTVTANSTVQYENNGSTPVAVFLGNDMNICEGETVTLDAGSGFSSYFWSSGTSNQTVTVTNLNPGQHQFSVIAFACGNETSDTINISVNPIPDGGYTIFGTTSVCQGNSLVDYTVPIIPNATSYLWTLPNGVIGISTTNVITVDFGLNAVSGNIIVKGVNSCGEGIPSTISVAVNPKPITPTISQNGNVLLSSSALGNQWYMNSTFIPNEFNQFYIPTQDGDYYTVISLNGCSSDASNIINFVIIGIDTIYNNNINNINVYPNPVTNELIIEIEGNTETVNFEIYNAIGQVVFKGSLLTKTVVNTNSFATGVYLIKLANGKTLEFKKIVKE